MDLALSGLRLSSRAGLRVVDRAHCLPVALAPHMFVRRCCVRFIIPSRNSAMVPRSETRSREDARGCGAARGRAPRVAGDCPIARRSPSIFRGRAAFLHVVHRVVGSVAAFGAAGAESEDDTRSHVVLLEARPRPASPLPGSRYWRLLELLARRARRLGGR
jgi:hypothetical protein